MKTASQKGAKANDPAPKVSLIKKPKDVQVSKIGKSSSK